ncbi:MAG TPA: o-succinylbenzoate synthase [Candidatus Methanoperedens sp.]|nr:o-succinylbenzoate synthase [Candidatus Methanoperedens sp.]
MIRRIGIRAFDLPLARPLRVGGLVLTRRRGLLVIAEDGEGHAGIGEAAPLPGLHAESFEETAAQLLALAPQLEGTMVPAGCPALDGACEAWLGPRGLQPSVRTGVEGAVLALLADRAGVGLARLLAEKPSRHVRLNGLLEGEPGTVLDAAARLAGEGYAALKIKVGRRGPLEEAELVAAVRARVGDAVALRLDANRAWDLRTALRFAARVAAARPAYIEEPVRDPLDLPLFVHHAGLPVALDETLLPFTPETPPPLPGVAALILKPTVLGGYERAMAWARFARRERREAIVSAAFPSAVGFALDAALAAALGPGGIHGLGTSGAFAEDLARAPIAISGGAIDTACLPAGPRDFALESTRVLR